MTMLFCIAESEIKVIHTYIHTIELAKICKFQLPVRSARVSHYDPRKWKVSCVSGGHLSNVNL